MEHSTSLCPEETAGYLKFIIDLSETCMNTCGILEKRSISNASHIDKFDTECLGTKILIVVRVMCKELYENSKEFL